MIDMMLSGDFSSQRKNNEGRICFLMQGMKDVSGLGNLEAGGKLTYHAIR